MSVNRPPGRVPTLTEVVRLPDATSTSPVSSATPGEGGVVEGGGMPATAFVERRSNWPPAQQAVNEEQLAQRVLADLQHQIELMLEVRMREVLTPLLTRATDSLVRDARTELASTLRDVVARAVAQEMSRHRGR